MSTSISIHGTKEIVMEEFRVDDTSWIELNFRSESGRHREVIFGVTLYQMVDACEKALHARKDEGYSI